MTRINHPLSIKTLAAVALMGLGLGRLFADGVTPAPSAWRMYASRVPMRPKPSTRIRLPWMVRGISSSRIWMAPSAVGMALHAASSSAAR